MLEVALRRRDAEMHWIWEFNAAQVWRLDFKRGTGGLL